MSREVASTSATHARVIAAAPLHLRMSLAEAGRVHIHGDLIALGGTLSPSSAMIFPLNAAPPKPATFGNYPGNLSVLRNGRFASNFQP